MDGTLGAETLLINQLTRNCGCVTRWLYLWVLMESWLMAVDQVGRHTGRYNYMPGSTGNHEKEGKTNNFGYSVYAVLGVNSWSWHGEMERDNITLYSVMMLESLTRKREMGDEAEYDVDHTSRSEKSGYDLLDVVGKRSYRCNYTLDQDSYLLYRQW